MWLMLPRHRPVGRRLGIVTALAALVLFGSQVPSLAGWMNPYAFWALAAATLVSSGATVTARNPVYAAIWFASALAGTAGLLLFQGAQFLAVATVAVYAGAIVVTFLFVLMLAQPEGHAPYDRLSWEAPISAAAGTLVVGLLAAAIATALGRHHAAASAAAPSAVLSELEQKVLAADHVARFGAELFGGYLVAVEVAGVLLLVALVGAVAIVFNTEPRRKSATGS
jgi:NADH-quinone oxidoreductase subunit J